MNQIPLALAKKIEEAFGYILNSNDPIFQPIYLKAAYLNPEVYSSLTMEQTLLVDILLQEDAVNLILIDCLLRLE